MTSEVMTKKVASEMLLNVITNIEDHERQDVFWEAVDMAIDVLRAENDLIDQVLEIIKTRKRSLAYDNSKDYRLACDDIESLVEALTEGSYGV